MGNSVSLPEKIFSSVQRNDVCSFQALVSSLTALGANDNIAARAAVLEYRDKNGRTALLVAAAKNHYQILQQLIQLGADLHYINPSRDSAGSALHEAARRRHEATVELLLAAGASPFAANAAGRTALDEAVLSGHTGVVRAIEKYAEFTGVVAFKSRSMGGLSHKFKPRYAVLMPYYPFGRGREGAGAGADRLAGAAGSSADTRKTRRCLWLYKDKSSITPRCRLWVDGAVVMTSGPAGTEGTLRLHTSYAEPLGDLICSFSHGYCVSLRPADLTHGTASVYHRLVTLLNGGSFRADAPAPLPPVAVATASPSPASMQHPGEAAAVRAPASSGGVLIPVPNSAPPLPQSPQGPVSQPGAAPPLPPPAQNPYYPVVPAVIRYGGATGATGFIVVPPPPLPTTLPPPQGLLAVPPPVSPYSGQSLVYPGAAGPCPMASPLSLHQHNNNQRQVTTAAGSPASSPPPQQQQQSARAHDLPAAVDPAVSSRGGVIGEGFIESMVALPGESDEAFAARLASAISVTSGQSQETLYPHHHLRWGASVSSEPTLIDPTTTATSAPSVLPNQPQRQSGSGLAASPRPTPPITLINFHSDPGNSTARRPAMGDWGQQPVSEQQSSNQSLARGPLDDLDMDAVNALIAATAGQSERYSAGSAASSSSSNSSDIAVFSGPPPQSVATPSSDGEDAGPSAPPVDPSCASPARRTAPPHPQPESEQECIICLNAPKEVGFLHGDSVHRCVCRQCSTRIAVGAPCPLCRQVVERLLGVY